MKDIRDGLIANLATIQNCQKAAYPSGNPTPPALLVIGFGENLQRAAMGSWTFELLVMGLAGRALNTAAERRLDDWLLPGGDQDVWAAIESDKTLGGAVSDLFVSSNDGTQVTKLENGTDVLSTTWHVQIIAL